MRCRSEVSSLTVRVAITFALAVGALLPLRAEFLVPDQELRCPPSDHACKSPHPLSSFESHTTAKGNTFTINFVEYNDKGEPWNPIELSDALDQLRKARGADHAEGVLEEPLTFLLRDWQFSACAPRSHISAVVEGAETDFGAFAETLEQLEVLRKLLIL